MSAYTPPLLSPMEQAKASDMPVAASVAVVPTSTGQVHGASTGVRGAVLPDHSMLASPSQNLVRYSSTVQNK